MNDKPVGQEHQQSQEQQHQERCNIITRDSLRPPCKRQRTRSTNRCVTPTTKEDVTSTTGPPDSSKTPVINKGTSSAEEGNVKQKCRRQWEQWSEDDQELFFQGIAEFGKDYVKIRNFMKKKSKGKSLDTKTKEQIRFFYHNTWSKISKNLKLKHEPDSKKGYRREIHYMLCLWELRKKGEQGFGHKVMTKLNDLVTKGETYVRYKGRNFHLRPPNRYLRKLYRNVTLVPDIVLPKHVNIEFLPHTNSAFNYVQKHAFNPRLRFTNVSINAKFSEVFDMFEKRFTDLYSREPLSLQIYPLIPSNINVEQFANHLALARNRIENHENLKDIPIILENTDELPENEEILSEDEHPEDDVFPKVFGKEENSEENSNKKPVNPFPGYWTCHSAKNIYIRTLYVALGEIDQLKFKYEWKTDKKDIKSFFALDSSESLRKLSSAERSKIKEAQKVRPIRPNPPDPTPVSKSHPVVVPGVIKRSSFGLPFRPRPGRRQRQVQSPISCRRTIAPRYNGMNKLLKNAVAVNLIPQPSQLVQYTHMLPDSTKLVNSGSYMDTVDGKSPISNSPVEVPELHNNGVVVTEATSSSIVHEEVVDEGFNQHFKSLTDILASSTLSKQCTDGNNVHQTAKTMTENGPKSPTFEWLNSEASVDMTLTSFLNVCEMQTLQQINELSNGNTHLKDNIPKVRLKASSPVPMNGSTDPTLAEVHPGDTNSNSMFNLHFQ